MNSKKNFISLSSDKIVNKLNFNSYLNRNNVSLKKQNNIYLDKAYLIYNNLINS